MITVKVLLEWLASYSYTLMHNGSTVKMKCVLAFHKPLVATGVLEPSFGPHKVNVCTTFLLARSAS